MGADALITEGKEFPDGMPIVGSPARALRPLTPEELTRLSESANRYAERGRHYLKALRPVP